MPYSNFAVKAPTVAVVTEWACICAAQAWTLFDQTSMGLRVQHMNILCQ